MKRRERERILLEESVAVGEDVSAILEGQRQAHLGRSGPGREELRRLQSISPLAVRSTTSCSPIQIKVITSMFIASQFITSIIACLLQVNTHLLPFLTFIKKAIQMRFQVDVISSMGHVAYFVHHVHGQRHIVIFCRSCT
jgi:hypothetical protein